MQRIVVVGAGVLGAALAARLAAGGAQVRLVDRAEPGTGTTAGSMAWLNSSRKLPYAYHQLNHAGMRAYAALAAQSDTAGSWYRRVGSLRWAVAGGPEQEQLEARVRRLADWGYPAEWISPRRAGELEPELTLPSGVEAVAWFPEEAYVETAPLIRLLLNQATAAGASVTTGPDAEVVGVDTDHGRVVGVQLAGGERPAADTVVCCAGTGSPALAEHVGMTVPLVESGYPGSVAPALVGYAAPAGRRAPRRLLFAPGLSVRPPVGGRVYLEAEDLSEEVSSHTPTGRQERLGKQLLERARALLPEALGEDLVGTRVCVRVLPYDGQPIVGPSRTAANFYVVVAHSGVTLAPRLAELVAAELLQGEEVPELAPYRPDRFAAGLWPAHPPRVVIG